MENLDDKTGGRITRSLRKRMSSIDSETSSRPGTPIGIKLPSINEIITSDSPSRSTRKTRRNSTIETITPAKTPSKSTTLKRLDTPDPVNSPMRRLTRRLSVSISEDDQRLQTSKAKLQFNALAEEDSTQLVYKPFSPKSHVDSTKNGEPKDSSPKLLIKSRSTPEKKLQTENINSGSSDGAISDVEVVDLESGDETEPESKMINSQKNKQDICELVYESDIQSLLDMPLKIIKNPTKADDSSSKLPKSAEKNLQKKEENIIKESTKTNKENVNVGKKKEVNNKTSDKVDNEGNNAELNQGKNDCVNPTTKVNLEKANVSASKRNKSVNNISREKQLTPTVRLKRLSGSEENSVYMREKNNSFTNKSSHTLLDTKRNEFEDLKVLKGLNESGKKEEFKITHPRMLGGHSKSGVGEVSLKDDENKLIFQEKNQSIRNKGDKNLEEDADDTRRAVLEGNHSNCEVLPETSAPYNPELMGELKSSTPIVFPRRSCTESNSIKSHSTCEKITPKHSSNISNSITQGDNVDKEINPRKEELSPSPEKLLRSGKIYGSSPPTISDPKKRTPTPVLEIKSPENNGAISKSVTQKPREIGKDLVAAGNPTDGNSPPTTAIIDTPKRRSAAQALEINSPENNSAISKSVTQKPHEMEKGIIAADNPADENSPPTTTKIDTLKKRSTTQALEINSPGNNGAISKSVTLKPHEIEKGVVAADNPTDRNSPPRTTIIDTPGKRSTTQVLETNSPENKGAISKSVTQKPHEIKKDIVAADNPTDRNSPPITTIIDTPKKRSTTQVLEINSPENMDAISKSVTQKPHEIEKVIVAADNPTDGNSPPRTTIIDAPKKRSSTQVLKINSPENKDAISKSVTQKPHEIEAGVVAADKPTDKENNKIETSFATSWSHNVSRKADESTKIDVVKKTTDAAIINFQDTSQESTKNKFSRYESDDNEDDLATDNVDIDIVMRSEEDDEEMVELAEDESHYIKHPFVEDEALEVDNNYESGDSLDSEERREIEENEIHDNGESIGSEDTEEASGDDVEDDDDVDSFFVNTSDDDEHIKIMETVQNRKKIFKRIVALDSSDSEDDQGEQENVEKSNNMNQTILNSNEIANGSKDFDRSSLNNEKFPKQYQDCEVLDSPTLGEEEDTNQISNTNVKPKRKSLNKSKQEKTKACLPSSSTECHNVNENSDKDEVKTRTDDISQSNDSGANTSKLSDCAKQLIERNDSVSASGSDLEYEADQKHPSPTKKSFTYETVYELNKDKQDTSSKIENKVDDTSENSRNVSLNKSSNNSVQISHSTSFEKLICEASNNTNFDNETDDSSKKEQNNSGQRLNAQEIDILEKSTSGSSGTNILRYETESDEEEEQATNKRVTKCKAKKERIKKKTSIKIPSHVGKFSSDDTESENVNNEIDLKDISWVQPKHSKNNNLSASFGYFNEQKDSKMTKSLNGSLKYMKKNEEEKNQTIVEEIVDENGSVSCCLSTSNTKQQLNNEEVKQLNISHTKNSKKSSQRQSLGSPTTHPDLLLSDKLNHKSICTTNSNTEYNPSASFFEKVPEHNQIVENQSKKRKRLSKSFSLCGSLDTDDGDQVHHLNKKSKISQIERVNSSTPQEKNKKENNLQHILGRCEEILEAANRAKLEAKQNYNKTKTRKRKAKHLKISPEATDDDVEKMHSQTELNKNDDRKKDQINQAIKAATDLLLGKPTKNSIAECQLSHPTQEWKKFSNTVPNLVDLIPSQVKNKDTKDFTSTLVNDGKNLKHANVFQSSAGEVLETPLQKKFKKPTRTTKIEHSTGTICVEPVTPTKQYNLSGFHESPMTPRTLGFKVRKILTPEKDELPKMPSEAQRKKRNRNQYNYEESKKTLPKPQWTQSGVFIEEDLRSGSVKHSSSTQFLASVLNRARTAKNLVSSNNAEAPLSNALQFKKKYLFRDNVPRESSREILQRKERKPHY